MKKLFQKWLFVFILGAFILTFGASWWIHSGLADTSTRLLLKAKLAAAEAQVAHTQENLQTVIELSNKTALAKARAFAIMIAEKPEILNDIPTLEKIRVSLDVDELHVSDEKGVLISTLPTRYCGFDMNSAEQSRPFMAALANPDFALVQAPQHNGSFKEVFQYAGVARLDQPGIVQIGYRPARLEQAMALADVDMIAQGFQIGNSGKLRILPRGDVAEPRFFHDTVEGVPSFCYEVPCGEYLLIGNLPTNEMYVLRDEVLRILVIANIVLFTVIFFLVSWLLHRVVIKGIYSVNHSLTKITDGNLNEEVKVTTTTEFSDLSSGINATVSALKKSIENEAKRIDAELEMGRTIQSSVLPVDFPKTADFDVAAKMYTAKEVGGDFYDCFYIDETHVALIVADVSGKGITAALFMMNAKALLKELLHSGLEPAEAMKRANEELCANNQAHMFMTVFLAVFNTTTGELQCVNAGHNPPAWQHGDAAWDYLRIKHGVALGVSPKAKFVTIPVQLAPGDRLLMYTDGVTEAMNGDHEQYGEARFLDYLNTLDASGEVMISTLRYELNIFAEGTPQSDDITLLALDYHPQNVAS